MRVGQKAQDGSRTVRGSFSGTQYAVCRLNQCVAKDADLHGILLQADDLMGLCEL